MKHIILAATLGMALFLPAARAQAPIRPPAAPALPGPPTLSGPSKVAFIDFQQAIGATTQGAQLVAGLKARFEPRQAQLKQSSDAIAALQKQLSDGAATMSADAKQQLGGEIQSKQRDLQQSAQDADSDYQQAVENVVNQVGNQMMPIIRSYATEHGYTLVIDSGLRWPQSPMLYAEKGTDITGVIVALYNKAHPLAPAN